MFPDLTSGLIAAATLATGLLAGASLDQSVKQLPARHRIGVAAYARYSQAADLANGVPFYATLGLAAAAFNHCRGAVRRHPGIARDAGVGDLRRRRPGNPAFPGDGAGSAGQP